MVTTGKPGRKLYRESTCKRFNLDTVLSEKKTWMLSSDFHISLNFTDGAVKIWMSNMKLFTNIFKKPQNVLQEYFSNS